MASLAVRAIAEITVLHPFTAAGSRDVLQDAKGAVGLFLVYQLHVAVTRRNDRLEFHVAAGIGLAAQQDRAPLVVGPHLQPALAVEAVDGDAGEPDRHAWPAVHVGEKGQLFLDDAAMVAFLDPIERHLAVGGRVEDAPVPNPEVQLVMRRRVTARGCGRLLERRGLLGSRCDPAVQRYHHHPEKPTGRANSGNCHQSLRPGGSAPALSPPAPGSWAPAPQKR